MPKETTELTIYNTGHPVDIALKRKLNVPAAHKKKVVFLDTEIIQG